MKIEYSRQIFEKYSYIKFSENPFSVSQATRTDERMDEQKGRQTDGQMTKFIVAFCNLANTPKN